VRGGTTSGQIVGKSGEVLRKLATEEGEREKGTNGASTLPTGPPCQGGPKQGLKRGGGRKKAGILGSIYEGYPMRANYTTTHTGKRQGGILKTKFWKFKRCGTLRKGGKGKDKRTVES